MQINVIFKTKITSFYANTFIERHLTVLIIYCQHKILAYKYYLQKVDTTNKVIYATSECFKKNQYLYMKTHLLQAI